MCEARSGRRRRLLETWGFGTAGAWRCDHRADEVRAVLVVGLTGGIGSGKSTFAALLAERGAQVIDADQYGRDALRPGQPAWHSVVDQFGEEILAAGSLEIDRRRLADVV